MLKTKTLIIIFGPTGVGKTEISIELAKHFKSEIFSADSRQIYKELGIAVAKPEIEQLNCIKHHFINRVSIQEHYSIYQYEHDCINELTKYFKSNNIAILVGGSGLYIDAILNGVDEMPDHDPEIREYVNNIYSKHGIEYLRSELLKHDPEYYNIVDLKNPKRLIRALEIFYQTGKPFSQFRKNQGVKRSFNILKIGIDLDREILYKKINSRVDKMVENGLVEQAYDIYHAKNLPALQTIGYRELFEFIEEKRSLEDAIELLKKNTRNFARRQITWFKRYKTTKWFSPNEINEIFKYIESNLNK
jgi:tRNA dimethylallyltransferase